MSSCLWKVVVGMALFGFVATLEAAVAKEPTAITNQTKSFEGLDRDAAHEAAMKWIDDLNQHGPLRIKRIVVVERGGSRPLPTPRASSVLFLRLREDGSCQCQRIEEGDCRRRAAQPLGHAFVQAKLGIFG
jgi:hypothetical protein